MRNPADIILELESNNSRLFKEGIIIREMENDNIEFFLGLKLALNKLITFGVKKVPLKEEESVDNLDFSEFAQHLDKLMAREVTGNAARDLLKELMDRSSIHIWNNWYRRIILKDLRCGVNEATVNNCCKKAKNEEHKIPVFSCQLAQDSNDHPNKMKGEKIIQSKLDGSRVLTVVYPDGKVDQFSRNGKEILNFQHIKDQFSSVAENFAEPLVFDGEIMSASFQDLMTQFYRKENVDTSDSVLNLFDVIPLSSFLNGEYSANQKYRLELLNKIYEPIKAELKNINVLGYEILNLDAEEGKNRYKEINKKALECGYEGIMIKDPESPYECKRSSSWLKLKPVLTSDLTIIGMEEGTDKYAGMLGALVCSGTEGEKEIKVNVGSGLTDEERQNYWLNKNEVVGKVAEIAYDSITQNLSGSYSLRFPRFVRLRGFEIGEKV